MTENVIVYKRDGQPAVSSRDVAEQFGKEHRNVIQSIKNLIAENSALTFMFIEDTYTAGTGKKYPMYYMNRDGFTLLAMGFTGKEALVWKLKYIQAFNMMEEKLKAQEIKAAMPVMDARMMEAQARLNNSRVDAAKLLMKLGDKAALQYQREDVYAYALHALIGTTPKNTERIESVSRFWLKE
ncbi:MAG: Rha family transcriptional regulator [Subdoligranulum variabile]|nr:Rha family transcriptional regulator [Subdoligranulum variabile]